MFRPSKKRISKDLRTFWTTKNFMCSDNFRAVYVIQPINSIHHLYDERNILWVNLFNVL